MKKIEEKLRKPSYEEIGAINQNETPFPKNCRLNYGSYQNGEFKYTKNHQNKQ